MTRRPWTKRDNHVLRRRYPNEPTTDTAAAIGRSLFATYGQAAKLGLSKSARYLASPAAHRTDGRKGINTRFRKGLVPWNKGLKGYKAGGRSAETRFRKGHKPQTWMPVGSVCTSKDGLLQRKVSDVGGYNNKDWKSVHALVWEEANGRPIPRGHVVVFRDRNRRNFDPANLELITRAENMRRNTLHRYPKEVAQLIRLRGALNRQINMKERNEEPHRRSSRSPV